MYSHISKVSSIELAYMQKFVVEYTTHWLYNSGRPCIAHALKPWSFLQKFTRVQIAIRRGQWWWQTDVAVLRTNIVYHNYRKWFYYSSISTRPFFDDRMLER